MTRARGAVALALAAALAACGGATNRSTTPSGAQEGDAKSLGVDKSISAAVIANGGLPSLGGAGNRERDEDAAPVSGLVAGRVAGTKMKLDGTLDEWPPRFAAQSEAGKTPFAGAVQYDAANLYVAGEVAGKVVRTARFADDEDHATLVIAFPLTGGGFAAYEIALFAGVPGESVGAVRFASGARKHQDVAGAKIVEAPTDSGYTFEAKIPWATFAEARDMRVGLRGALRFHASPNVDVATGPGDAAHPELLAALPTECEHAVAATLLAPRGLRDAPTHVVYADIAGDAMKEKIAVYPHLVVVSGPTYRGGSEFYFRELDAEVVLLDARHLTGRGKDDLIVRRRFAVGSAENAVTHEWLEVWSVLAGDEPTTTFAHEIALNAGPKRVTNFARLTANAIEVAYEPAVGWDARSFREPSAAGAEPLLLPWGATKNETFRFKATRFTRTSTTPQAPQVEARGAVDVATTSAPTEAAAEVPRAAAQGSEVRRGATLAQPLIELYKRDHHVPDGARPRFDFEVDLDGDARPDRVLLFGRDIVIAGPSFRGGTQYAALTLTPFDDARDVTDLLPRDVTGDGAADLVVRGVRHLTQPGAGVVDQEVLLIYQVRQGSILRVFGIETARGRAGKRVEALVQIVPHAGGRGLDVDARPGVARGWTKDDYPWRQEQPGAQLEPLLLPWGGIANLHYVWNGSTFEVRR